MTEQHPIVPPSELAARWRREAPTYRDGGVGRELWLIDRATQWGSDQELEACCHEVQNMYSGGSRLRAARRPSPKPPETIEVDGFTYRLVR
jgi:hypothetical protein